MVCKSYQKYGLENAYRKVCMSIAETEANINMFNRMIREGVSTNDIRHFSVKQAEQCRVYKKTNLCIEKVAMKSKRTDALALVKRLRQIKHRTKQSLKAIYTDDIKKAHRIIDKINRKASGYRSWLKELKHQKIDHLAERQRKEETNCRTILNCHPRVRSILKDINTDILNLTLQHHQ